MSVNDDLRKAEEERLARLEANKNKPKPYGPKVTQYTPEQWSAIVEETKTKRTEKEKAKSSTTGDPYKAKVTEATYQAALDRVRNATTDAEAAKAADYVKNPKLTIDLAHPDDLPKLYEVNKKLNKYKTSQSFTYRIFHKTKKQ